MRTLAIALFVLLPGLASADALEQAVNKAIDKGVAALKRLQNPDGRFEKDKEFFDGAYPGGMTALCLFALSASGVPADDPVMKKGFAALRKVSFDRCYTAAVALLAIESAYGNPPKMWYRKAKRMDAETRALALRLTRSLVDAYNAEGRGWAYTLEGVEGPHNDHSNTQLVLLALKAACRLGLGRAIPTERWDDVLKAFLQRQENNGPLVKGPLAIKLRWRKGKWKRYQLAPRGAEARGWDYDPVDQKVTIYGSMVAAAIASSLICQSELVRRRYPKWNPSYRTKVHKSVNGGLAWLAKHWSVSENPRHPNKEWHYYYLYAIERVGVFLGLEKIGAHDWYREGARLLVDQQDPNGEWKGNPEHTCYALLFLKRATKPVLTGDD